MSKPQLLLLHGALGSKNQFKNVTAILSEKFEVLTFSFIGHGGEIIPEDKFSIQLFSDQLIQFLDNNNIQKINVFGYSMGGYVALLAAKQNPNRFNKIFTFATKFAWTKESAAKEVKLLNPEILVDKVPKFAAFLEKQHAPQNWKQVMLKTAEMMLNLGAKPELPVEELTSIDIPVRVGVGDQDNMVSKEETINAFQQLSNGELLILPSTQHPWEKINPDKICHLIIDFFYN